MRDLVMEKYPASLKKKGKVISHCFQPLDYPQDIHSENKKFVFSHIGILRSNRNPQPLFAAASMLLKEFPEFRDSFCIELVGSINSYTSYTQQELERLIQEYDLGGYIECVPTVSYTESLQYMKQSDCLVVIDVNLPKCAFILSKAIDYIGAYRPIIGIMPADNPTAYVIKKAGYESFTYGQIKELSSHMKRLITGEAHMEPNEEFIHTFHVRSTTRQLLQEFSGVINQCP